MSDYVTYYSHDVRYAASYLELQMQENDLIIASYLGESTQSSTLLKWSGTSKHLPRLKGLSSCFPRLDQFDPVTYWPDISMQ